MFYLTKTYKRTFIHQFFLCRAKVFSVHTLIEFCLSCLAQTTPVEIHHPQFPVLVSVKYSRNLNSLMKQSKCRNFLDVYDFTLNLL